MNTNTEKQLRAYLGTVLQSNSERANSAQEARYDLANNTLLLLDVLNDGVVTSLGFDKPEPTPKPGPTITMSLPQTPARPVESDAVVVEVDGANWYKVPVGVGVKGGDRVLVAADPGGTDWNGRVTNVRTLSQWSRFTVYSAPIGRIKARLPRV